MSKPKALLARLVRDNPHADEASIRALFNDLLHRDLRKGGDMLEAILKDVFDDVGIDEVNALLTKKKH